MEYKVGGMDFLLNKSEKQMINASWVLLNVRSGMGMCRCQGRFLCLDEGELLLLPPGADLAFDSATLGDEYNANVEASVICFDRQWLESLLRVFPHSSQVILALRELTFPSNIVGIKWFKLSDLINQIQVCRAEEKSVLTLKILELISDPEDVNPISERTSPVPETKDKIAKIDRFISCNLHRKFSLEEIAAYAGMNRTYFCLFFKKHMGMPLMDYINGIKVQTACRLLKTESLPISDISERCGFKTVTYFNRVFKNATGMSPSEYRKKMDVTQ
jgi:AraC-like DNA-binding protein